jgi:hypothetical protein
MSDYPKLSASKNVCGRGLVWGEGFPTIHVPPEYVRPDLVDGPRLARLFAASPDLLAAAKVTLEEWGDAPGSDLSEGLRMLRAAIEKVEG